MANLSKAELIKLSKQRKAEREQEAIKRKEQPIDVGTTDTSFNKPNKKRRKWKIDDDIENRSTKPMTDFETKDNSNA